MAYRIRAVLICVAVAAALVPLPERWVERVYSHGIYLSFQPYVTAVSNRLPVALLDVALAGLITIFGIRIVRDWRSRGARGAIGRFLGRLVTAGAVVYLLFLGTWGLNYRRVPLTEKLVFDPARVSEEGARRLATIAIGRVNAGHAAAHSTDFRPDLLEASFAETQIALGAGRLATTGRPKASIVGVYFRYAAVDGMTVPVFLEVILNPDVLPIERPSVLAHEWAHLAGYADESEANFIAWAAGARSSDPVARYSAWLDAYRLAAGALPRAGRASLPPLDEGPRQDLRAIAARYARSSPAVRIAAREMYDSYLKANRVEAGIESYELALRLMLGSAFADATARQHPLP